VLLFWGATLLILLCATAFIIPALWGICAASKFATRTRCVYTGLLVFCLGIFSYFLYQQLGSLQQVAAYQQVQQSMPTQSYQAMRPLYTKLQRELVKEQLDLPVELENVELILNFAQIHSQAQAGVLQPEIQSLLQAVLKVVPQQVTALNLLAIHAYKTADYAQAIALWQDILRQLSPEVRNTEIAHILRTKIAATQRKSGVVGDHAKSTQSSKNIK